MPHLLLVMEVYRYFNYRLTNKCAANATPLLIPPLILLSNGIIHLPQTLIPPLYTYMIVHVLK